LFQSAPAISGGRIAPQRWFYSPETVSIRARHLWRANLPQRLRLARQNMFQSAPAISGGRIDATTVCSDQTEVVSIRARHLWRANLFVAKSLSKLIIFWVNREHSLTKTPAMI
jgi:hypothetical protein